jgi:hypothetical protein
MAPYNGAVEHTQGEFKGYLDRWSWKAAGTLGVRRCWLNLRLGDGGHVGDHGRYSTKKG